MNSRISEGNILRTAKRIFGLAGMASLALFCVGPVWAQSKPIETNPVAVSSGAAAPETSPRVKSSSLTELTQATTKKSAPVLAQNSADKLSEPKGRHEGITVHGHWTIEVRNPDGTVASHRAFDNELVDAGAYLLGNLMAGMVSPAGWALHLVGTNSSQLPAGQPGPCGTGAFVISGTFLTLIPNSGYVQCSLLEAATSSGTVYCAGDTADSFCTLTRTPAIGSVINSTAGQVAITLRGTFPAPNAGWVGGVASDLLICENFVATGTGLSTFSPSACMTGLPAGQHGDTNFFTATLLPSPVQVTAAGQTVAVTLTLSFQ